MGAALWGEVVVARLGDLYGFSKPPEKIQLNMIKLMDSQKVHQCAPRAAPKSMTNTAVH
jgi:hypothetical protein